MANAFDVTARAEVPTAQRALIERREQLLGPAYRLFYAEPLHIVRGEGVWLYDASGAKYLDAYNNVASLGHCHPHVVEAITRQVATLATHTPVPARGHPRLRRAAARDISRVRSATSC